MLQCDPRVSRESQPCNFAQAKDAEMQFCLRIQMKK